MSNDNRTREPHGVYPQQAESRGEHDGFAQEKQLPVTSDELLLMASFHYTVEWDTSESEWCGEANGTD